MKLIAVTALIIAAQSAFCDDVLIIRERPKADRHTRIGLFSGSTVGEPSVYLPPTPEQALALKRIEWGKKFDEEQARRAATRITPPYESGPARTEADKPKLTVAPDPQVEQQKASAEKGFAPAQYALGIRYLTGNGVEKNEAKAKQLIKAAADQGLEPAREKLRTLK